MKNTRILNGYIVIYKPEHPKAMTSENWNGYIYEHIVVAEEDYGRYVTEDEDVHHLDFNKSNNTPSNLVILSKRSHHKLHYWLEQYKHLIDESLLIKTKRCISCNKPIKHKKSTYCSKICFNKNRVYKLGEIDVNEIITKLKTESVISVARYYNISDNGLRKFLKAQYNINVKNIK